MVEKHERLQQMVERDLDARSTGFIFGIAGLFVVLTASVIQGVTVTTMAMAFLVTQLPTLYQSWQRMKLLSTFNKDPQYQQLVSREFTIVLTMFGSLASFTFISRFFTDSVLELVGFSLIWFIPLVIWYISVQRELAQVDPEHVSHRELRRACRDALREQTD